MYACFGVIMNILRCFALQVKFSLIFCTCVSVFCNQDKSYGLGSDADKENLEERYSIAARGFLFQAFCRYNINNYIRPYQSVISEPMGRF